MVGVNYGWFCGRYANDMGYNQYSNSRLWQIDNNSSINFNEPDPQPPKPLLAEKREFLDDFFKEHIAGLDILRIWLFEGLEGLCFDENKKIVGIDKEFLNSFNKIAYSAKYYNVRLYLCLFDSWIVNRPRPANLPKSSIQYYNKWSKTVSQITTSIIKDPTNFINNALNPLIEQIKNNSEIYAIDLMNEPEGMIELHDSIISHKTMRMYISECCKSLRLQGIRASTGCMRRRMLNFIPICLLIFVMFMFIVKQEQ